MGGCVMCLLVLLDQGAAGGRVNGRQVQVAVAAEAVALQVAVAAEAVAAEPEVVAGAAVVVALGEAVGQSHLQGSLLQMQDSSSSSSKGSVLSQHCSYSRMAQQQQQQQQQQQERKKEMQMVVRVLSPWCCLMLTVASGYRWAAGQQPWVLVLTRAMA